MPTADEGKLKAKAAKKDGKVVKSQTDMLRFSWAGKAEVVGLSRAVC